MAIVKEIKGKTITHNGETYLCDKNKDWYVRVSDLRHNGDVAVWQSINKLRVPLEVLKQV